MGPSRELARQESGTWNQQQVQSKTFSFVPSSEKIYLYQALVKAKFTFATPLAKVKANLLPLPQGKGGKGDLAKVAKESKS